MEHRILLPLAAGSMSRIRISFFAASSGWYGRGIVEEIVEGWGKLRGLFWRETEELSLMRTPRRAYLSDFRGLFMLACWNRAT